MRSGLDGFPNHRIAVIGDVMLDWYLAGDVTRISPEAPVPVMHVRSEQAVAGGAANVAANLASLDIKALLVGLTGKDAVRDELIAALRNKGEVGCEGIVADAAWRTTRKLRIIGARQQIVRVDQEEDRVPDAAMEAALIAAARAAIDAADGVIISDYSKGVCSPALVRAVIDHARTQGKKVLVDPKQRNFSIYRDATLLTPNRKELGAATGLPCESDEECLAAARAAQAACRSDILLTRSEKGMSYYPVDGEPYHLPTVAQDVFDVSGAGDTVIAVIAAALIADLPLPEAMRLANHAAGIVVSKLGTASVTRGELAASLGADTVADLQDGALLSWGEAAALRNAWARDKLIVGLTNGCFDLIHPGHVALLRKAAQACDRLIVALNTDSSVQRLKGPARPVQDELARAAVIGGIKGVSAVTLFGEQTPLALIEALQPDILIKGADYTVDTVVGADVVRRRGGRVVLIDLEAGHSTTRLVARMTTPAADGSGHAADTMAG